MQAAHDPRPEAPHTEPLSREHEGTSRKAGVRSGKGSGRGYGMNMQGRARGENIKKFPPLTNN